MPNMAFGMVPVADVRPLIVKHDGTSCLSVADRMVTVAKE